MPQSRFMTTAEVAELLAISHATVTKLIREGRLPAIRISKDYRVERADVDQFIAASRVIA